MLSLLTSSFKRMEERGTAETEGTNFHCFRGMKGEASVEIPERVIIDRDLFGPPGLCFE